MMANKKQPSAPEMDTKESDIFTISPMSASTVEILDKPRAKSQTSKFLILSKAIGQYVETHPNEAFEVAYDKTYASASRMAKNLREALKIDIRAKELANKKVILYFRSTESDA